MIGRSAALLILISQVLLLGVVADPVGDSAILFGFVGHPILGLGILLGLAETIRRRRARLHTARPDPEPVDEETAG